MEWFYSKDGKREGPISQEQLEALVAEQSLSSDSLVWRKGMTEWEPYQKVLGGSSSSDEAVCVECGKEFSKKDMVSYADTMVCAGCKDSYFQKIKEGALVAGQVRYGGFWLRLVATVIDGIIQSVPLWILMFTGGMLNFADPQAMQEGMKSTMIAIQIVNFFLPMVYITFFLGRFGATPGKMAVGLKVLRPDLSPLTYGRAFGRYWASWLSTLTIGIGYLIAAWDSQKRTLHDRICDTRVVRK